MLKAKKITKHFLKISLSIFFFFLFFDYLFSNFLNNSNKKIYSQEVNGFYKLNKNLDNYEIYGSNIYKVYTDQYGNRIAKNDVKKKYDVIFLGDSAVYGMDNYENSIISIIHEKKKINILNSAVPSYSPTTYLYSYKNNLKNNLLMDEHIVLLALDISDVQDEAGRWITKNDTLLYDYDLNFNYKINSKKPSTVKKVLDDKTKEIIFKKENFSTDLKNFATDLKNFAINNLRFSVILYRALKFSSFNDYDPIPIINTPRSAFTWRNWDELDLHDVWRRGYKPLGVKIALEKNKNKIIEIVNLAKKNDSKIFFVIYPHPAQLAHQNELFSWTDYVNEICNVSYCDGVINTFNIFKNYSKKNINWYEDLYLIGDIHFNKFGNEIIADEILKIIYD